MFRFQKIRFVLHAFVKAHSEMFIIVCLQQLNTLKVVHIPHVLFLGISKGKDKRAKCHEKKRLKEKKK